MDSSAEQLYLDIVNSAGGVLTHPDALLAIINASMPARKEILDQIGFKAKFLVRTWSVMRRLGAEDAAREQLKGVFQEELSAVRTALEVLVQAMPVEEREPFVLLFLTLDGSAFARMMELLPDLAWVQNVNIDRKH